MYVKNSDSSKYGSLMEGFVTQYSLGHNQYPTTMSGATDVLSQHKYDERYYEKQKVKRNKPNEKSDKTNKTENRTKSESHNQDTKMLVCYCCGKPGHSSDNCTKRNDIP